MAKKKKLKEKTKVAATAKKDPRIEETYDEVITFMCPKRGLVKQKVKVKRYRATASVDVKNVLSGTELEDILEEKDDGMSIYSDGDAE